MTVPPQNTTATYSKNFKPRTKLPAAPTSSTAPTTKQKSNHRSQKNAEPSTPSHHNKVIRPQPAPKKVNSGSGKQSGYLSCRSRTFSNLDVVLEVEREEYSRCSDDSKTTTLKTMSIATNGDIETSFSSVEEIFGLKAEAAHLRRTKDQTKEEKSNDEEDDESTSDSDSGKDCVIHGYQEKKEASKEEEIFEQARKLESAPTSSVLKLSEPTSQEEILECRKFLVKIGVIDDDETASESVPKSYNSKSDVIAEVFRSVDKDNMGRITFEEFLAILNKINASFESKLAYSPEQMNTFARQFGAADSRPYISFEEFLSSFEMF